MCVREVGGNGLERGGGGGEGGGCGETNRSVSSPAGKIWMGEETDHYKKVRQTIQNVMWRGGGGGEETD